MKLQTFLILLGASIGVASAFNYIEQGLDWPGKCKSGKRQSPIGTWPTIETGASGDELRFYYNKEVIGAKLVDTATTTQVYPVHDSGVAKQRLTVNGTQSFDLRHFEFHAPAEHRYNKTYDLEMQIVHQNEDKSKTTIVAIFFDDDASNKESKFLKEVLYGKALPINSKTVTPDCKAIGGNCLNLRKILNEDMKFYRYEGSVTTPECPENVTWFVATKPLAAATAQLAVFTDAYDYPNTDGNFRVAPGLSDPKAQSRIGYVTMIPIKIRDDSAFTAKSSSAALVILALSVVALL